MYISAQSENLRNLEITLRILRILRLRKLRLHTIVDTELFAQQRDERRQDTMTETTCASAPEQFSYLARQPVNRIGGGQHGVVSTVPHNFIRLTFHMLGMRHMICMCIYLVV